MATEEELDLQAKMFHESLISPSVSAPGSNELLCDDNIKCPGCDEIITIGNAGGYRTYCDMCVDQMPPIPSATDSGNGYYIEGSFPHFEWVKQNT